MEHAPLTREETDAAVCKAIADALTIDVTDVQPAARLDTDLYAESMDMHDVMFRIERAIKKELAHFKIPSSGVAFTDFSAGSDDVGWPTVQSIYARDGVDPATFAGVERKWAGTKAMTVGRLQEQFSRYIQASMSPHS